MTRSEQQAEPLLTVRDLCVTRPANAGAGLTSINLQLAAGESLGLMGRSGSGKTTLALALMGLLPAADGSSISGSVAFAGQSILGLPERRLRPLRGRQMAMMFQNPAAALNPMRSVGSQLMAVLRRHRGLSRAAARAAAIDWFECLALAPARKRLDALPSALSGGACQRVLLAMALAGQPRLLIADEATSALDATMRLLILQQIESLRQTLGLSLLWISHDPAGIARLCDRIAVLDQGRLVEQGPTIAVFRAPQHPATRALLGAVGYQGMG